MRNYEIKFVGTNGCTIKTYSCPSRNRWDALAAALTNWGQHDRRDIANIEIKAVGKPFRDIATTRKIAAVAAGWRVQQVCIDGSIEFNGWQAYRPGISDNDEPEMGELFDTKQEAWEDAWKILVLLH